MPTVSVTVGFACAHVRRQPRWVRSRWRYRRRTRGAGVRPGAFGRARGPGCRLRAVSSPSFRFLESGPECFPECFVRLAVTVSSRFQREPFQGALAHHLWRARLRHADNCLCDILHPRPRPETLAHDPSLLLGATTASQRSPSPHRSTAPNRRPNLVQNPASAGPPRKKGHPMRLPSLMERWAARSAYT